MYDLLQSRRGAMVPTENLILESEINMAPFDSSHQTPMSAVCFLQPIRACLSDLAPKGVQTVLLTAAQQEGQGTMWISAVISERPEPSGS